MRFGEACEDISDTAATYLRGRLSTWYETSRHRTGATEQCQSTIYSNKVSQNVSPIQMRTAHPMSDGGAGYYLDSTASEMQQGIDAIRESSGPRIDDILNTFAGPFPALQLVSHPPLKLNSKT